MVPAGRGPPSCPPDLGVTCPANQARRSQSDILTTGRKENALCIALASEWNSAMNRGDLADLNAFVAIADHLNFRAASTQLGVTASALSHTMRQLEERLADVATNCGGLTESRPYFCPWPEADMRPDHIGAGR